MEVFVNIIMNKFLYVCGVLLLMISMDASSSQVIQHLQFMLQPTSGSYEMPGVKKFFICSSAGQPHPSYDWLKDSEPLEKPTVIFGTLMLTDVGGSDEGTYRCVVSHPYGALISTGARLRLAHVNLPDVPLQTTMERTASQGQALILEPPPVDGLPPFVPQWFEQDEEGNIKRIGTTDPFYHVTSGGQLIVLDIKEDEDGKNFRVLSSNHVFPNNSIALTYKLLVHKDVQEKFEMVLPPKDVMASSNNFSIYFECVANARPISSLDTVWYFKSDLRSDEMKIFNDANKYIITKFNRLLTIKNPSQSDEGTYRCEVATSSLTGQTSYLSRSARLIFQAAPNTHTPSMNIVMVDSGDPIGLACHMDGNPTPLIRWFHNAKVIEDHSRSMVLHNNMLQIARSSRKDSGYYQCFASNSLGEAYVAYYVNITATPPVITSMSPAKDSIVMQGNIVTLHCVARGVPRPNVTWYQVNHGTNTTSIISPFSIEVNRIQVEVDVTSTYICQANNNEGQVDRSINIRKAVPTTIFDPSLRSLPQRHGNLSILSGDLLRLTCVSSYDSSFQGETEMFWSKDGSKVSSDTWKSRDNSDRFISDAKFLVFSQDEPSEMHVPDGLEEFFSNKTEAVSFLETLEKPSPGSTSVVWVLELMVSKATRLDGGRYTCTVSSPGMRQSIITDVIFVEPPEKPFNVTSRLSRFRSPWITVQWEAGHHGNSPIRRHLIYGYINDNLDPLNVTQPMWELLDVIESSSSSSSPPDKAMTFNLRGKPSHSYTFCVSSVNDIGEGLKSEVTEPLRVPMQIPSGAPLNVFIRLTTENSVVLSWNPPNKSEWNGPLLGFTAKYRMSEEFRRFSTQHHQPWKDINSYSSINILDPKSRELKIDDLRPFTSYEVSVAAYNGIGIGPYSNHIAVTTEEGMPKKAPGHVTVAVLNSTSINVTFILYDLEKFHGFVKGCKIYTEKIFEVGNSMLSETGKNIMTDVAIETASSSYSSYFLSSPIYSFLVTNLTKFTWYQVGVSCYNSKGEGPISNKVRVQTEEDLPGKVNSLRFKDATDISFVVDWLPPAEPNGILTNYILSYKVKDRLMSHWLEPSQTSHTIGHFEFETAYHIQVAASTKVGVGESEELIFETPPPPEFPLPPSDIMVEEVASDCATLIVRRHQSTYVRLIVQVSIGPDRNIFNSIHEDFISSFQIDHNEIEEEDSNVTSSSLFHNWKVKAEAQSSKDDLETLILLKDLQPYSVYRLRIYAENSKGRSSVKSLSSFLLTEGSIPSLRPEMLCGMFTQKYQAVVLKWMPLPRGAWNGPHKHSKLRVSSNCTNNNNKQQTSGCLEESLNNSQEILPLNSCVHEIKYNERCYCYSFSVEACNLIGCSGQVVMDTSRRHGNVKTKDIVIVNVTLVPIQATKMFVTWKVDDDDDDDVDNTCFAFKILYYETPFKSGLEDVSRVRRMKYDQSNQFTKSTNRMNRGEFKIVSGHDKYALIEDLKPGTAYGFSVLRLDGETVHRYGNLSGNDDDVRNFLLTNPVYAKTMKNYHHEKPLSSSSSDDDWVSRTKNWMIIIASILAGFIIVVVIIAIYVTVRRSGHDKKKSNPQTVTNISLNHMTYDPLEPTNSSRGQQHPSKRSSWKLKKAKQTYPMLYSGKAPPRPSPGSIQFNDNNNDPNKSPMKFPHDFTSEDDDKFFHGERMKTINCGGDDDDAPPLPPPPEVDDYDPDSIFSHQLTHLPDPSMSAANRFSTLPPGSCFHADDFVVDYFPQPFDARQPITYNETMPGHPHNYHHHLHQYNHGGFEQQSLSPPPPPMQFDQLWLQRNSRQECPTFDHQSKLGNSQSESETAEVRCMTIGRRYKSPKVAPYV